MPSTFTPRQAIELYCSAFARRAPDEMEALFADDAVFDLPLNDTRHHGRAQIMRETRTAIRGLRNIEVVIDHITEQGETGFAEGYFHAEHVGISPYVDGRPARLDFKFVAVAVMEKGKVKRWSEYFDTKPLKPHERSRIYPITRRSPYWQGAEEAGVSEFMIYNHVYFPLVYHHSPAEEYAALTERVTLWDVGCERQTEIAGPDAVAFANFLTTRNLAKLKPGDCRYTVACDPDGQINCDPVLLHPTKDLIWLSHGDADLTLWARGIALQGRYRVEVREPDVAPLQIQGPHAIEVLRPLIEAPIEQIGFYKCVTTRVAGIEAVVSRTGWSGGPGYEVFPLSSARAMDLWHAIREAGRPYEMMVVGPIVDRAVEKGVTDTAYHSNSGMNPYEAGHGRLVDLDKGDFVGREALARISAEGPTRKTVGLFIEGDLPRLEWYWPLEDERGQPGEVRWAVHSWALDRSIGIALVDAAVEVGDAVRVHHPLGSPRATITNLPFV
jgi:aminomethyltransferase